MSKKEELLQAIAGKNRGLLVKELEKVAILAAIAQLEDFNPTPRPVERLDLLEGDWRLLYTTSKGLLGFNRVPLVETGQIYQCIRTDGTRVYNFAELGGLPFLEGLIAVAATFEPVSAKRVNVKFNRSIIGLQKFLNYRSPQDFIKQIEAGKKFPPVDFKIENREQKGWLDITYLDDDLRIGRGNEGSVFVLTKDK
ncbi:MAG: PAP/fibrillin family protein [Oscillatoria sp. PMC 1068.18]|nr:PAP/fibrillin family protein [Oscillatoria sp. PMC 1076.18]MEC4991664.1 PAP/fibrillin family protein [Oscillatoria sp. PMC 1068.18]